MNEPDKYSQNEQDRPGPEKPLSEARIKLILTEDILLRSPLWALVVLAFLGSIAFGTVWFFLHYIRPLIEQHGTH